MASGLRLATPADAPGIHAIYAPVVETTSISFEIVPPSVDEMAARVRRTMPRWPWLVAVDDGGLVEGYCYAHQFAERAAYAWSVETSVFVRQTSRGSGVGRRMYRGLVALLVLQGYHQAFAGIAVPNPASFALHQSVGFQRVGTYERVGWKHGEWRDVAWWQLRIGDGSPPSGLPRSLEDLPHEQVTAALEG